MCPEMANVVLAHKTMKEKKLKKNNDYKTIMAHQPLGLSINNTVILKSNKQISLLIDLPLIRLIV